MLGMTCDELFTVLHAYAWMIRANPQPNCIRISKGFRNERLNDTPKYSPVRDVVAALESDECNCYEVTEQDEEGVTYWVITKHC